jgi:spore coat protein H
MRLLMATLPSLGPVMVLVGLSLGCGEGGSDRAPAWPGSQPEVAGGAALPPSSPIGGGWAPVEPLQPMAAAPPAPTGTANPGSAGAPAPVVPSIARPQGWQETSHARGAKPDYARLFADDRVHRIDVEMSPEAQQMMEADLEKLLGDAAGMNGSMGGFPPPGSDMNTPPRDPTDLIGGEPIYVPVTIRYDGAVWTQVGMRYKGNSSLASAWRNGVRKLGFRLDFDRYELEHPETTDQRFFGFAKMTFSSGFQDPSLIRDKLAADILTSQSLVTARCAFYRVYVDVGGGPVYWGLYTMIEDPSDQMIEAQFADKSGNLYKPDGPGADWTSFQMEAFEKKSNEVTSDYSDVMAAISALHAARTDAQVWRDGLEAKFNVSAFLKIVAFSRATGHWDGYGIMAHNYYLYGDPTDEGRLLWISWDHNLSLRAGRARGGMSVMMDEVTEAWPLIRFLLDDTAYRAQYKAALQAALGGMYEKSKFDARAAQLHTLVTRYVVGGEGETGERAPYTFISDPNQFRNALSDPSTGMLPAVETLRQAVRTALMN